ncbi:MAG: hypothetical protein RMZ69_28515 [Nostoc sp. ChiQUE01a]|nr:hypothetical protein [Nostoc sp. ChiQUE01a]
MYFNLFLQHMEAAFECNYVSVKRESVSVEVTLNMLFLLVKKREFNEQNRLPQRLCRCQEKFPDVFGCFRKVSDKPSFRTLGAA